LTPPPSALVAALADRYRIERELGAGGMATVYLAHDVRHDRKVALKVLRPELSAILGAERFLAEIKTTANLQHPHILSLFDSGEADGTVFYVMPYVEGESLRDRIKRDHQLPIDEAVRIAREVADALEYAHQHGIVHRDIKPENILLHGGHAMVADFGIALAASRVDGGTRMTETGMSLGTPHYMSPEQAMGEREITPRADIYALGCVLYEMLTAEPPFVGATAQAIFARVLTDEPRSLTLQRKTIPPNVEAAVRKALQKLPADRFATAAQFAEALVKADFTGPATRVGAVAAAAPRTIRQRVLRAAPWALVVLTAGLALYGWLRSAPAAVSRQRITLWTHAIIPGGMGAELAISPDGASIVFVDTAGGTPQLWTKEHDQLEPRVLTGTAGAHAPVFSPNGEWIAFASDGKLKKVPRLGGSAITIADSMNMLLPAIAWLDDGVVAFNNDAYSLLIVNQDGGPTRTVIRVDSLARGAVSVTPLPGGRGVLVGECVPGCAGVELVALDLKSGGLHVLGNEIIKGWVTPHGDLVFVRRDGGVFAAPFDMKKMAFGAAPVPVLDGVRTTPGRADFAMSANGMLIYVAGAAEATALLTEAVWVGRDGKVTPVDAGWSFVRSPNLGMALSPDGHRLALSIMTAGKSDVWIKQLDNGPLTRLTFAGDNERSRWTADGRTVMYTSNAGGAANEDIHARRADGTGPEQTLLDLPRPVFEFERTPDTTRWIVRLGAPPSRDIFLWQRGAKNDVTPLIADAKASESEPSLSPDGRWLAYVSNESGRPEVYVRPFPNVESGRWQVSRNGGSAPLWAHNGRELFFRGASANLIAVTVRPGPSFVSAEEHTMFSTSAFQASSVSSRLYDITPDDRRFLFVRTVGGPAAATAAGPPNLVRVDNWFIELRASRRRP
jgi:Tol biopolymer transport system component